MAVTALAGQPCLNPNSEIGMVAHAARVPVGAARPNLCLTFFVRFWREKVCGTGFSASRRKPHASGVRFLCGCAVFDFDFGIRVKPSPAFKWQIFGAITVTRVFRRIWHGNKVKIKTSDGQFGTVGKMPACICRAVCIIIPPLSHAAEVTSWAMRRKNFSSWRGFLFNPGAGAKQRQPPGHGGEPER